MVVSWRCAPALDAHLQFHKPLCEVFIVLLFCNKQLRTYLVFLIEEYPHPVTHGEWTYPPARFSVIRSRDGPGSGNSRVYSAPVNRSESATTKNIQNHKESATQLVITYYRCGEPGHVAPRCLQKEKIPEHPEESTVQRRVNVCAIKPATESLCNLGEKFSFCFDSGCECSLIKESVSKRFPGKRCYDPVTLLGIGKSNLKCSCQILATVTIQNHCVQLLFHVVPDDSLSADILIGRDFGCVRMYRWRQ